MAKVMVGNIEREIRYAFGVREKAQTMGIEVPKIDEIVKRNVDELVTKPEYERVLIVASPVLVMYKAKNSVIVERIYGDNEVV